MEEIRGGLCRKPVSFSQESAGVGLQIFTCHLCIGRLGVCVYPLTEPARKTAGRCREPEGGAAYFIVLDF